VGSGFKTFTAGSVLTASDVQNYLQDQAVMVFGGTAARSSAIGTANFEEGMLTYLTDVDKLQVYTGSSFQDVYPPAATSQGMTLINTTSFSGVTQQIVPNVFSTTYTNYRILVNITSSAATFTNLQFRYGSSSTPNSNTNYNNKGLFVDATVSALDQAGAGKISFGYLNFPPAANSGSRVAVMDVFNPFETLQTLSIGFGYDTSDRYCTQMVRFDQTTSFTDFVILPASSNITGSISIYGYNK
jgi:hypothetical protein